MSTDPIVALLEDAFQCDLVDELCSEVMDTGVSALEDVMGAYVLGEIDHEQREDILCNGVVAVLMILNAMGQPVVALPEHIERVADRRKLFVGPGHIGLATRLINTALAYVESNKDMLCAEKEAWGKWLANVATLLERSGRGIRLPSPFEPVEVEVGHVAPRVEQGTIVGIPIGAREFVEAQVLFSSARWPGLIVVSLAEGAAPWAITTRSIRSGFPVVLNTIDWGVRAGAWQHRGRADATVAGQDPPWWIEAGELWHGDERVRWATPEDYTRVPNRNLVDDLRAEYLIRVALGRISGDEQRTLAECYYDRGVHFLNQHQPQTALALFTRALEIEPRMPSACLDRAAAWEALGNLHAAQRDRARAAALRSRGPGP